MQKKLEAAQSALSEVQSRAKAAELSAAEGVTAKQQLDQIASQLAAAKKEVDNARTNANKAQQVNTQDTWHALPSPSLPGTHPSPTPLCLSL